MTPRSAVETSGTGPSGPDERPTLVVYRDGVRRDALLAGLAGRGGPGPVETLDAGQHDGTAGGLVEAVTARRPGLLLWEQAVMAVDDLAPLVDISRRAPMPILLCVAALDAPTAKAALQAGVSTFVFQLSDPGAVALHVEIARERFRQAAAMHAELQRSKDELAARKTIERAKGLLMERRGLTEREAYDAMRRMAMSQGKTVGAIADIILSLSDILP